MGVKHPFTLADRLNAGETILTVWSSLPDTGLVQALAASEMDAVTLDMQHGGHTEQSVWDGVAAVIEQDKPVIVRIPVGRFDFASRALDFGADAVIAPMINSVDEARDFADFMKYPPLGKRSWGVSRLVSLRGEPGGEAFLKSGNRKSVSFAMIETRQALDALDAILDLDGIDGVFVGPADFSIAYTDGATVNGLLDDMTPTVEDIARRSRKAGKHAGIFSVSPEKVTDYAAMGYNFISAAFDTTILNTGVTSVLKSAGR